MFHIPVSKILDVSAVGLSILALQGCSKTIEGEVFLISPKGVSERLSLVKIHQLNVNQVEQFRQSNDSSGKKIGLDFKSAVSKVDLNGLDKQLQLIDAADEKTKIVMRQCVARRGRMVLCLDLV